MIHVKREREEGFNLPISCRKAAGVLAKHPERIKSGEEARKLVSRIIANRAVVTYPTKGRRRREDC